MKWPFHTYEYQSVHCGCVELSVVIEILSRLHQFLFVHLNISAFAYNFAKAFVTLIMIGQGHPGEGDDNICLID